MHLALSDQNNNDHIQNSYPYVLKFNLIQNIQIDDFSNTQDTLIQSLDPK